MLGRALAIDLAVDLGLRRVPDAALEVYGAGAVAITRGGQIARGARHLVVGSSAVRAMGARRVIAGEFLHGPGDRRAVLEALSVDFAALGNDVTHRATSPSDAAWALVDIVPAIAAWSDFAQRERASTIGAMLTDWKVFERWRERLVRLRELCRARGIALESPEPGKLPETIWERGEHGTGSGLDRWFTLAKWAVYAGIGLVGFASLYSALRTTRQEIAAEIS